MYSSPYEQYRSTQVETASPERLLLLLYDAAISSLNQAKVHIAGRNREESNRAFLKAEAILAELQGSLDMSVGEIAKNLFLLYDYFIRRLIEANLRQDQAIAAEIAEHLKDLRSAWKEAMVVNASSPAVPAARLLSLANVSG